MSKRVLVTGATGKQGGAVVSNLLSSPSPPSIRAISRNPDSASAQKLKSKGVEVVKASLEDEASLVATLEGIDAAFLVTTVGGKGDAAEDQQGYNFINAAKQAKTPYIVFTSVSDATPTMIVPHFVTKAKVEERLKESGLKHAVIAPVAFYDNFPLQSGFATMMALGMFDAALYGKKLQMVAVEDIGKVAALAIQDPEKYAGRTIKLAGDDLTMEEARKAYEKVEGKSVWKAWLPGFVTRLLPYDFRMMFKWFYETGYSADIAALRQEFPDLLTFEDWLKKQKQQS